VINRTVKLVQRAVCNAAVVFGGHLTTLSMLQEVFYSRLLVGLALWTPGFDPRRAHFRLFEEILVLEQNIF